MNKQNKNHTNKTYKYKEQITGCQRGNEFGLGKIGARDQGVQAYNYKINNS